MRIYSRVEGTTWLERRSGAWSVRMHAGRRSPMLPRPSWASWPATASSYLREPPLERGDQVVGDGVPRRCSSTACAPCTAIPSTPCCCARRRRVGAERPPRTPRRARRSWPLVDDPVRVPALVAGLRPGRSPRAVHQLGGGGRAPVAARARTSARAWQRAPTPMVPCFRRRLLLAELAADGLVHATRASMGRTRRARSPTTTRSPRWLLALPAAQGQWRRAAAPYGLACRTQLSARRPVGAVRVLAAICATSCAADWPTPQRTSL